MKLKSNIAWYRVQAFIQQLVDTRPDMVTREVVGKTIVSFKMVTRLSEHQVEWFHLSKEETWTFSPSLNQSSPKRRLTLTLER